MTTEFDQDDLIPDLRLTRYGYERDTDTGEEHPVEIRNFSVVEFVRHYRAELEKYERETAAEQQDSYFVQFILTIHDQSDLWAELEQAVSAAEECIDSGNTASLPNSIVRIVYVADQLSPVPEQWQREDTKRFFSDLKRTAPLRARYQRIQEAQREAKETAIAEWAKDTEEVIRITEMADIVYRKLVDEYEPDLPQRWETIKNWIRSVAPAYAKRPGRPRGKIDK
jgi:hypothetical protein